MFDFREGGSNPAYVFVGIIVAQLFMYGRKVKERKKIHLHDVIADGMQFGVMFIVCMGFLALAKNVIGWDLNDPWQLVTVVIIFNMSFDTWFTRIRETFNSKAGGAFDVLLGRKIAVDAEEPPPHVASRAMDNRESLEAPLKSAFDHVAHEPVPAEIEEEAHKLDDYDVKRDDSEPS
jgi:hypothetical protein